jgi:Ca2+-binding EF-hand superfamily protein
MADKEEEKQLKENFKLFDKNGNGSISKDELLEGYKEMYKNRLT